MIPHTHPQDDVLTVAALEQFSYQHRLTDPELSDRAWFLAVAIADQHGLEVDDAIRQVSVGVSHG